MIKIFKINSTSLKGINMHIVTKFMLGSMVGMLVGGCQKDVPMYQGYAFNAMIENAHVVELKDPKKIPILQSYVRDVHWKLDRPIDGHMHVHYGENKNSKELIGTLLNREPMGIVPLQSVDLRTDAGIQSDSSVQINGASSLSKVDVLRKNILPKGDYIFRLKVHGTHNWDRKEIYVQVR